MMSASQTFPGIPVACSISANMEHLLLQTPTASSHSYLYQNQWNQFSKNISKSQNPQQQKNTSQIPKLEATTRESSVISMQPEMSVTTMDSSILNMQPVTTVAMTTESISSLNATRDECDDNNEQEYPEHTTSDNCGYDNGEHSSLNATRDECDDNNGQQYPEHVTSNNCGYDKGEQSDINASNTECAQSLDIKAEGSSDRF